MTTETSWRIQGDVLEACNCNITCPCNFGGAPTEVPCQAVFGWRIQEGNYGNTRLDGVNVVLYFRTLDDPFEGGWTAGNYIDERATSEQAQALEAIFSGQAGSWPAVLSGLIAHQLEPKQVPIMFETVDGEHRITVPGLLEVESERVPNPLPGEPPLDSQVSGLSLPIQTGPTYVRRANTLKLTDPNLSVECSQRHCLIGQFDYSGP